jgi:hypothetical protein
MAWFKRRKEAEQATLIAAMSTAFAQALGGVLSAQSEQIKQSSAFLGTLQDLSARKASQILGSRGGRETQKRKKKLREATAAAVECVLCADPMHRGTTLQQIEFHRQHESAPQLQLTAAATEPEVGN